MANLFKKARITATTTTTKATDKKASILVNDPSFFTKVQMLETLQENMKRDKAKSDMLSDEIKEISKDEWVKFYEAKGSNPGSVLIEAQDGDDTASVMFIPTDKYISITPARANELVDKYGEEIVEEKTTFSFDALMVEKYGEVISNLIENCREISDSDKDKIIKAVTTYSVAKGTIDRMRNFGDVSEIMEEVKPVCQLKNVEIIKG
jgi:hypothetical protein